MKLQLSGFIQRTVLLWEDFFTRSIRREKKALNIFMCLAALYKKKNKDKHPSSMGALVDCVLTNIAEHLCHHSCRSKIVYSVYFHFVLLCSLTSGPTASRFAARPLFFDHFTFSNDIASTACGTWIVVWIASIPFTPVKFIVFCIV